MRPPMIAGPMLRYSRRENASSYGDFTVPPFCATTLDASRQITNRGVGKRIFFSLGQRLTRMILICGIFTTMTFTQTDRTKLKRLPKRGHFDRETVYGILDEGFICHVGFAPQGQTFVIPTGYARVDDKLYIHGSQASRMLRTLSNGIHACVTVTLLDGLVLARSAFHHSMNYRSVVVFGKATLVEDPEEKMSALFALSEQIIRGRWNDVREPTDSEMKQTTVLSLSLEEASAKIRTGPPLDDEEDYSLPMWAGVVPLKLVAGEPVDDPRLPEGVPIPEYASNYKRPTS